MTYQLARRIAVYACERLQPFCQVINIAGSLRRISGMGNRNSMEVKDIDIICVPKYTDVVTLDLFGNQGSKKVVSINFSDTLKEIGEIKKGKPDGRYMSLISQGAKLDIFMPNAYDFYRQYCIRTGSDDYIRWNIATAWNRLGWCGTDQGLRRITDCEQDLILSDKSKRVWKIKNPNGEKPPAWESEPHFFDWLGVKWIQPRFRKI